MLIKTKSNSYISESDVTDHEIYQRRRDFIKKAGGAAAAISFGLPTLSSAGVSVKDYIKDSNNPLGEELTEEIKVTSYNIIGLPDETEDMIIDTIDFNRKIKPDNITVAFYSPYQGTIEAAKGEQCEDFNKYEENVDGQLRTVSHSKLIDPKTLNFYKKYFSHFVFDGLEDINQLKQQEGIQ